MKNLLLTVLIIFGAMACNQSPQTLLSYEEMFDEEIVARWKADTAKQQEMDFANYARYKAANEELGPPNADEYRVVFLGNSITEAWANQDPGFFSDNHFVGRGISGQTSVQLVMRFQKDVVALDPKAVVIHIGTNDVAENTGPFDPVYTMSNIQYMVEMAKANGIKVILATVLPSTQFSWRPEVGDRSDMIVDLNNRIREYAESKEIPVIDYHAAMKNDQNGMDPSIAPDGVHPSAEGFAMMKSLVMEVLR